LKTRALVHVRNAMKSARGNKAQLDLIELALSGKKIDFSKVIGMIDDMVALLKTEQNDDADKKEYCETQFDQSDDKEKALERDLMLANKAIDAAKKGIATTDDEIAALKKAISDLDKAVMEATEQRKSENADFNELIASDTAAKELLLMAKNRLNKYYNPKLYVAPAKKELSAEGAIERQMSLSDVSAHHQAVAAPLPPPETLGALAATISLVRSRPVLLA
jgi:septal ring factor EnvC (AmiA/AmiB activator)